jgi:hypothetical protein
MDPREVNPLETEEVMKIILRTIEEIWKKNPELRIGQLILNAVPEDRLYYAADITVLRKLCEFYKVEAAEPGVNIMEDLMKAIREKEGKKVGD